MLMLNGYVEYCGLLIVPNTNLLTDAGLTVNLLLVPVALPDVAVIVPRAAVSIVTVPVQTPAVNAVVVVGLMVPMVDDRVAVPV